MANEQGERVLLHINDAQSWLSRASSDFQAAERVRGELDLSLAQAEVKYAWELSRGRTEILPNTAKRRTARWWLPVAACLGAGFLGLALPYLISHPGQKGLTAVQQAALEPKARIAPAGGSAAQGQPAAPTTIPAQARTDIRRSPPGAKGSSRLMASSQTGEALAASTDGDLAFDLGELERVAHETLMTGSNSTDRQR